jgi:hypothetical protein
MPVSAGAWLWHQPTIGSDGLDICPRFSYIKRSRSLGTPSGGKPEDGAGAVPAGGFALRSRAASGLRPAGTMTGLRGARWTGTG